VDVVAALTTDGKLLTVAIINANESAQEFDLSLKGIVLSGKGRMWLMTGESLNAATGLGRNEVRIVETPLGEALPRTLTVAPISITLYEFAKE
jgi:alpha-N-arabinofuranosidase